MPEETLLKKTCCSRVATLDDFFGKNASKSSKNSQSIDNDTFEYKKQQEFGERKRIKP
jgi:hypothetical protein